MRYVFDGPSSTKLKLKNAPSLVQIGGLVFAGQPAPKRNFWPFLAVFGHFCNVKVAISSSKQSKVTILFDAHLVQGPSFKMSP